MNNMYKKITQYIPTPPNTPFYCFSTAETYANVLLSKVSMFCCEFAIEITIKFI